MLVISCKTLVKTLFLFHILYSAGLFLFLWAEWGSMHGQSPSVWWYTNNQSMISDFPRVFFLHRPIWQEATSDTIIGSVEPFRFTETRCLGLLSWLVLLHLGVVFIFSRRGQWDNTVHSLTALKKWNMEQEEQFVFPPETSKNIFLLLCWLPDDYNMNRLILWLATPKHKLKQVFFRATSCWWSSVENPGALSPLSFIQSSLPTHFWSPRVSVWERLAKRPWTVII